VALEWQKRCKKADTYLAERRQWWTRCKQYYIEESTLRYGRKRDEKNEPLGYQTVYRVMAKRDDRFDILVAHKTKNAAIRALEYYAEHGKLPPKQPTKAKRRQKAKRKQKKAKAKKAATA
jgi:transposase